MNNGAVDDWFVQEETHDQDAVTETVEPKGWVSTIMSSIGAAVGAVSFAAIVIAVAVLATALVLWIGVLVFLKTFTTVGS